MQRNKKTNAKATTIWNRNYILCMLISSAAAMGHGIMNPAMPVYAKGIGIDTERVGMIMAAATLVCMFARGFAGGLADRHSRKKLVLVSLLISLGGYITYFFVQGPVTLLAARTLQTVGNGMNNTVLSTMAFSAVPPERLASGIGMFSLAGSLAQCFAPNIGTEIAYSGRFNLVFTLASCICIAAILVLSLISVPEAPKTPLQTGRKRFSLGNYICRPAIPAAIMLAFNGMIHSSIANYLSLYGIERDLPRVGLFFTVNSIVMLLTRPMVGKICDTLPLRYVMVPGYAGQICACLLLAFAGSMPAVCAAAVMYGFGFGSTQSAIQIMAIRSVCAEERGKANGTYYVGGDIGLAAGAYVAGKAVKETGYKELYILMACMALFCVLFFLIHDFKKKKSGSRKQSCLTAS